MFKQIVAARTWVVDGLGWCLRFSQSVFGAPVMHPSARAAWDRQHNPHPGELPPMGVQCVIWFDHWGNYGSPRTWGNWGHVAIWLGDGRVLSSPLEMWQVGWNENGSGQGVYASILDMMRALGGNPRYLGWSEDMNGARVVRPVTPAPIKPAEPLAVGKDKKMFLCYFKDAAGPGQERWAFFGPGLWFELSTKAATERFKAQNGIPKNVHSFDCGSEANWLRFQRVSGIPLEEIVHA